MIWINAGYAPAYPKMGQEFELHFYLVGENDEVVVDWPLETNIAAWLPADPIPGSPPEQHIKQTLPVPADLSPGLYLAKIAIIDKRTALPINLAIQDQDSSGRYLIGDIVIPWSLNFFFFR
jgi:hypothetical protein